MADEKQNQKDSWQDIFWDDHRYNERRKLKSGLYLRSFCPHCDRELMRNDMVFLEIINANNEAGWIELSPYLNVFNHETDIGLPDGEEIKEVRCPHCHHSLVLQDKTCGICNSSVASFLVGVSNSKVPFLLCMREGCHWHAISPADENDIILDDSQEW